MVRATFKGVGPKAEIRRICESKCCADDDADMITMEDFKDLRGKLALFQLPNGVFECYEARALNEWLQRSKTLKLPTRNDISEYAANKIKKAVEGPTQYAPPRLVKSPTSGSRLGPPRRRMLGPPRRV